MCIYHLVCRHVLYTVTTAHTGGPMSLSSGDIIGSLICVSMHCDVCPTGKLLNYPALGHIPSTR